MTEKNIIHQYKKIYSALGNFRISRAVKLLYELIELSGKQSYIPRLSDYENTYKYMLHYFVEGYDDDMRDRLYNQIISDLYVLADKIYVDCNQKINPELFFSTLRICSQRTDSFNKLISKYLENESVISLMLESDSYDMEFIKKQEILLSDIFDTLWTTVALSENDRAWLYDTISSNVSSDGLRVSVVSALLLGSLRFYDRNKLILLIDLYNRFFDSDEIFAAKALVAVMLIMLKWGRNRISDDKDISLRISAWSDSLLQYSHVKEVVMSLIRTRDTDRISEKMKNEVIPELMKINPQILNKLKEQSFETDFKDLEQNPEWEDLLRKSGLAEKMMELSEMQSEGGDVMMMAFSNLKNFPFFNKISNWFLPYYKYHSELPDFIRDDKLNFGSILDFSSMFCDSDRYSFMFAMNSMDENRRKMTIAGINSQQAEISEQFNSSLKNMLKSNFNRSATDYVRNIYRFMKLFRRHDEFEDPFVRPFDFIAIPHVGEMMDSEDTVSLISEFYFKRGYYAEALPMLIRLSNENSEIPHIYEKIGFCYQMIGDLTSAISAYNKALLFNPDSEWIKRKIALCYRNNGDFAEAIRYYQELVDKSPEELSLIMNLGNMKYELGDIKSALKLYYKAAYINPDHNNANRMIAWCEFLQNDYEKSDRYFDKLFTNENTVLYSDCINRAYLYIVLGKYKDALQLLKRAMNFKGRSFKNILKSFEEDREILSKQKIDPKKINMILDDLYMND